MMNNAVKNIIVRVIKNRIVAGEDIEAIWESYPKLTQGERDEISKELDIEKE
jgi:uncharacterized protein (DUF433 family)